ncbi:LysR family transcriptional regulator [Neorhizobium sp. Rsf11]|uniref:LysR family transcriptional regulator n=2 Tax=Neorhizobium TaxID=1525371 RepID=A0ABV0M6G3_9HYPH|nr:LysR family transcriptional regulator [Neorhizobium petrolearium]MCC2612669.1 LysR family transcriptional regulator [Neorhizobium petrolearium]WGI67791.1 LysR family transcriptional regulator [Neorhizobium petrolearium]
MDRLDRMQLFTRIVERRSFSAAASDLGLARSTVTESIKQLEDDIGVRLLERTTRHVTTTLDGRAFYERCLAILAEVDEAENIFRDAQPRGLLRVDAHGFLTRTFLLPRLHEFLDRYPLLELQIGQGDRLVDLVREGVDCVIRAGEVADSGLIMRRLGTISEITCASPAYIERHGMPQSPDALAGHAAVGFISSRTGQIMPLEFMVGGEVRYVTLPARLTVNNSDTLIDLARRGYGLMQAPRYRLQPDIDEGALVEVLASFPPPPTLLSALYPQNRQLSPRVRVFIDWIVKVFAEAGL